MSDKIIIGSLDEIMESNTEVYNFIYNLNEDTRFLMFMKLVQADLDIATGSKNECLDNNQCEDALRYRGAEVALEGVIDKIENLRLLADGESNEGTPSPMNY